MKVKSEDLAVLMLIADVGEQKSLEISKTYPPKILLGVPKLLYALSLTAARTRKTAYLLLFVR